MIPIVMSIDDDDITQMLYEYLFEDNFFCTKLVKAYDGKESIDYFEEQSKLSNEQRRYPDLIFLDINMPGLNGWAFLDYLTEKNKVRLNAMNVIVVTSSIKPEDKYRAEVHPLVLNFIPKPLSTEILEKLKTNPALQQYFV
ncbi:response regulator [Limnovirga soli]|uniref:Response regulator n=1 Tax=Limnovirga soli TaxID=2656915 RepID=A0A8J8FBV6_9BACT|nr:response regulator [Limnovirga soli]NNV54880.1 response regulator [Limnovirga soli]